MEKEVSLGQIARQAMLERGLYVDFPPEVQNQVASMPRVLTSGSLRDMRHLLWFSIDNDDSLDLDQLTYVEISKDGKEILYVAIADVDDFVPQGSAIDQYAAHNTTSVYTPTAVFHMLPSQLSTDLTSLNQKVDRHAVVVEIELNKEGSFVLRDVYPALVRNQAKLTYSGVAAWFQQKDVSGHPFQKIVGLSDQLRLHDRLAQRLKENRYRQGALSFGVIEVQPQVVDGIPIALKETVHNRANVIIENCMIATNVCVTKYLMNKGKPTLRRIVRTPNRWDRIVHLAKEKGRKLPPSPDVQALRSFLQEQQKEDPLRYPDLSLAVIKLIGRGEYVVGLPGETSIGHFDLALHDYAHTTAPNRRFPDLVMQRLLRSCFLNRPIGYGMEDLKAIGEACTKREDDATKVERRVRKSAVAMVMKGDIGQEYQALVTGASEKGTWVRLVSPPVEGKLIEGFRGLDVGDSVKVKLVEVDIARGFIDFVKE